MNRRELLVGSGTLVANLLVLKSAMAEWTPRRPINAIVPYDAGGGTDTIARAVVSSIGDALPVPVVVVNKPGSSGMVGATAVANAKKDGGTIMITSAGSFVLNYVMREAEIDPFTDFIPIAQIGDLTTSVMVPTNSPYQTLDDLVNDAKANPGKLRWAHTGAGSFHHVAGQGFLDSAEITAVDVPFKGGSATRAAVIGGQVEFGMIGIQQLSGFESELRALALVADKRDDFAKDVPTFDELGYKVPLVTSPIVVYAPSGVDEEVVTKLQEAIKTATQSENFIEVMSNGGNSPAYLDGAATNAKLMTLRDDATKILKSVSQ